MAADKIFLLMGIQGSGKGTQAARLSKTLKIPQISTGDIFRATVKGNGPLSDEVRRIINAGDLVPDELTSRMVRERLAEPDAANGFILDGYPRTKTQVQHLDEMLAELGKKIHTVFFFDLPEEETIARLEPRRVCTADQTHIYHLTTNPPKQAGVCDIDGAPLKQRDDDKPDAIRKRVSEYMRETLPLLDDYRLRGLVRRLDATKSIDTVADELLEIARV
jgi:adenylate kinase